MPKTSKRQKRQKTGEISTPIINHTRKWTLKKINDSLNTLEAAEHSNPEIQIHRISDYYVILRLLSDEKYFLPNEIINKIIENKYNIELNHNIIFNRIDINLSMIQVLCKQRDNFEIFGYNFMNEQAFNATKSNFDYAAFEDIAMRYAGMGHQFIISRDKKYGKYLIRTSGGSNGWEWDANHTKMKSLNIEKYKDNLMTFKELIDYLHIISDSDMMEIYTPNHKIIC